MGSASIPKSFVSTTKNQNVEKNDLNLIVTAKASQRNSIDDDINILYMKAVNLYQNKHYEECAAVTKSVLTLNPNHVEAGKLLEYIVTRKYETENVKPMKINFNKFKKKNEKKKS